MIDWVTTELPCTHRKLEAGMVCKVKPDGELDWMAPCRVSVAGSHDSSIQVRSGELESADVAKTLLVSGVLGILPPNTAKASEAPMFTGL